MDSPWWGTPEAKEWWFIADPYQVYLGSCGWLLKIEVSCVFKVQLVGIVMDVKNLVTMANRIGDFFASIPDEAEAKDGIASHIHRFWEPRMRLALLDAIRHNENELGLSELVKAALAEHPELGQIRT